MIRRKIQRVIAIITVLLFAVAVNNCSDDKSGNNDTGPDLPAFMNGIDENTYLALWSSETYSTTGGQPIPPGDLPYKYFASKGINFARIRVWAGNASDGDYANALANGLAAKAAGLKTLLAIFLSESWPDNVTLPCDQSKVAAIFRNMTFEDKMIAVPNYIRQRITDFNNAGLHFDLYAVDNEVYNCVCGEGGESNKANMAALLNASYDAIRAVDPKAKFVFHIPHVLPADASNYFDMMLNTYNVRCDYLSTSFYPLQYGGTAFEDYKTFVENLYQAYKKPFIISEWAYSNSPLPVNSIWPMHNAVDNYDQTPDGQAYLLRDLLAWAKGSNGKVAGVFYWSPMFNLENYDPGTDKYYGWLWLSLFDIDGNAQPAVESLSYGSSP